jgi:hypothetical protein
MVQKRCWRLVENHLARVNLMEAGVDMRGMSNRQITEELRKYVGY